MHCKLFVSSSTPTERAFQLLVIRQPDDPTSLTLWCWCSSRTRAYYLERYFPDYTAVSLEESRVNGKQLWAGGGHYIWALWDWGKSRRASAPTRTQAPLIEANTATQCDGETRQMAATRFAKRSANKPDPTFIEVKSGWSLWPMEPPTLE